MEYNRNKNLMTGRYGVKKALIIFLIVFAVISGFLFLSGYRLTPEAAARAHSFVGRDSALVLRANASVGETFVFKVKDYYVTVAPYRQGLFWLANFSSSTESIGDKADLVRTLGMYSVTGKTQSGTVWIIQSTDSRVAAIKVASKVSAFDENGVAILDWSTPLIPKPSDISAIDSNGNTLYIYTDNDGLENTTDTSKTKWYKI